MSETGENRDKLEFIAQKSFAKRDDMYEIVDFLNKSLKDRQLMFGLSQDDDKMTIKIYEV